MKNHALREIQYMTFILSEITPRSIGKDDVIWSIWNKINTITFKDDIGDMEEVIFNINKVF